jgi:hypothetical protein
MGRRILVRAPSPGRRFYRTYYEGTDPRAAVVDEFRLHLKPGELHDKMMLALHIGASVMLGRVPSPEMYAQAKLFAERASQQAEEVKKQLEVIRQVNQAPASESSVQASSLGGLISMPAVNPQKVESPPVSKPVTLPAPLPARLSPRLSTASVSQAVRTPMEPQSSGADYVQPVLDATAESVQPSSAASIGAGFQSGGSRAAALHPCRCQAPSEGSAPSGRGPARQMACRPWRGALSFWPSNTAPGPVDPTVWFGLNEVVANPT